MGEKPPVTGDLNSLLRRVAQHDADAFAEFYDLTSSRVFGLVARVLRDPGYSEETTQEVYLQVWRNAGNYDPASRVCAGLAADACPSARGGPRARRAGRSPARIPLRKRHR